MNSRYTIIENFKSSESDRKASYLRKLVFLIREAVKTLKKEV